MTAALRVTVVVPTQGRPASLRGCLSALSLQTGPEPPEILVVDDGSDDAESVRAVVSEFAAARLIRQERAGPAAARNRGAREARGELVCFTDDDCEPAPDWVARLGGALTDGVDAAGGITRSGDPGDRFAEATEVITSYFLRRQLRPDAFFVPSNNLACRRRLVLELPFDQRFLSASGEDRDWCARLLRAGGRLVVEPGAVVLHFPSSGIASFWRQHLRYGRGAYRLARGHTPRVRLQRPAFYVGLVRAGFARGARCGMLVAVAQLATAVGFVREALSRRAEGRAVSSADDAG